MIKKHTIEMDDDCDGKGRIHLSSQNDGFGAFELLGILEHARMEALRKLEGIRPIPAENMDVDLIDCHGKNIVEGGSGDKKASKE